MLLIAKDYKYWSWEYNRTNIAIFLTNQIAYILHVNSKKGYHPYLFKWIYIYWEGSPSLFLHQCHIWQWKMNWLMFWLVVVFLWNKPCIALNEYFFVLPRRFYFNYHPRDSPNEISKLATGFSQNLSVG